MRFGDNLRKLRKLKKLSQEDLAEKMNVSRQSVSKWETGDAYPEMNNILELCKIFHCNINDLVNDSVIDIGSLDEEIKMSAVKFKKDQQSKMKCLSKTITIIARIGKIICIGCIPIIIISMLILGVVFSQVRITDNEIIWKSNDVISVIENDNGIVVKINDRVIEDISNNYEIVKMKNVLENNSKIMLIGYVETGFLFVIITLVLASILFNFLEKLFNNINRGDTPFTIENVGYIKRIAYLLIALAVFPNIVGVIFEMILRTDLNIGFEMFSLVEILFLFSIAYIFQYGYEIQLDSKGKMYGDEKE